MELNLSNAESADVSKAAPCQALAAIERSATSIWERLVS
ncbi:unannotated protein [freshwater metagenome]|uniref:Unannotated protein n=1 Tax=freshwater metagenome TaxID=449393 RepID=A0A6J7DXK1_9ZZZZ